MPAPLATPETRTVRPPAHAMVRDDILGLVSVVMIARANGSSGPPSVACARRAAMCGISGTMRSIGSCTPITPVELTSTDSHAQPIASETASTISCAFATPRGPVAAFAQPEFRMSADAWPRESFR